MRTLIVLGCILIIGGFGVSAQTAVSRASQPSSKNSATRNSNTSRTQNTNATPQSGSSLDNNSRSSKNISGSNTSKTYAPNNPQRSGTSKTIPTAMPTAPTIAPVTQDAPKIHWMTLEEAIEKSKTEKRKLYIDVYTQWCGWCKRMDETTFSDPEVVRYMNDHYYAVKFDAEQEKDINFQEKNYKFRKNGARGYHELASAWLNNRLSFPTSVFLDENFNVIQPIPGYLDGSKMEAVLNYFGTNSHKTTPWETYERRFNQR